MNIDDLKLMMDHLVNGVHHTYAEYDKHVCLIKNRQSYSENSFNFTWSACVCVFFFSLPFFYFHSFRLHTGHSKCIYKILVYMCILISFGKLLWSGHRAAKKGRKIKKQATVAHHNFGIHKIDRYRMIPISIFTERIGCE